MSKLTKTLITLLISAALVSPAHAGGKKHPTVPQESTSSEKPKSTTAENHVVPKLICKVPAWTCQTDHGTSYVTSSWSIETDNSWEVTPTEYIRPKKQISESTTQNLLVIDRSTGEISVYSSSCINSPQKGQCYLPDQIKNKF